MSDAPQRELEDLKARLAVLTARVWELEQRLGVHWPKGSSAPTDRPVPAPPVAIPTPPRSAALPAAPRPTPAGPRPPAPAAETGETLETKIGRYWLNRIGIFSLVLGIAFFILYSFQYLGPVAKIGIGFAVGAALIGLGVWMERHASLSAFARGLIGGGWAIVYFTTYAMHHIPAVRVLPSALADLVLLTAVVAGAVAHALKYRSQVVTALAFLLGFITTSISDITGFTLASSAVLVIGLVTVAVRMRWHGLLLYGVLASYLTHWFWVEPQIGMSRLIAVYVADTTLARFWLSTGFLGVYWVAYTAGLLSMDERDPQRRNALLTATLANSVFAMLQLLYRFPSAYEEARYAVFLGGGAAHLLLSIAATARTLPTLSTVHVLLGLTWASLAVPERLNERWTGIFWLMEVASLTWLGLRYGRWAYRAFAFGLGVVMVSRLLALDLWQHQVVPVLGWLVPWRRFSGLIAVSAFAAAAAAYRSAAYRAVQRPVERSAFHLYAGAASLVAWLFTAMDASRMELSLLWSLEATALVALGWRLPDRVLRLFGAIWWGTIGLRVALFELLLEPSWWNVPSTWAVVALLFAMGLLYRLALPGTKFELERALRAVYEALASVLLTGLIWRQVSREWLSQAWALEGLALIAAGFALRDRTLRIAGLSVFGVLVLKILFVDLAGAETIYRILSFIVAGAILLVASLAYTKFSTRGPRA